MATQVWDDAKIAKVRKELLPLHDPRSLCYNDGYYAKSLERKYGRSLSEIYDITGVPTFNEQVEWKKPTHETVKK